MNTGAIDKIIARLSGRDYRAAYNRLTARQKYNHMNGKYQFQYTLGADTLEAIDIKREYLRGIINEEQYKAFCLRKNLED